MASVEQISPAGTAPHHSPPQTGEPGHAPDPNSQLQRESQQQHHNDPNLSSIVAFNQSYDSQSGGSNVNSNRASPAASTATNQWGKRPGDHDSDGDSSKRQQLDNDDARLAAQLQAANNGHQYSEEAVDDDDDDEDDQDYVMDEEENEQEHQRMRAELDAAGGANPWGNPMGILDQNYALWDAKQNLRIQSLPILDNLSSQILQTLGKGPYTETINIVTQPESGEGQAYNTMKSLFDQTKKLYTHEAFLSADELKLESADQRATIRKVNLATFVSSVFGSQEVGFFHLNEHFLDTFVPDGGRLLKSQGSLYLDLKTQAYISAMSTGERTKEEILEDLFPNNMTNIILSRRPGAKQLTPSEQDFVARLIHRRQHLLQEEDDASLSEKYVWQDFLKEVSWYVSKNHETIVAASSGIRRPRKSRSSDSGQQRPQMTTQSLAQQTYEPQDVTYQQPVTTTSSELSNPTTVTLDHTQQPSHTDYYSQNPNYMGAPPLAQPPIPNQTQPTQVLYERARLAATSKASPNARRAGLPSQRRPWTTEEENALMAGLDRVKGPHWSQILAMFGPGGTVSEALKDRNQVQLKDKARNLKLFFLKSGIEVPYYLQFVTGELKTRAPGQAAKNAAKKQVEATAEEDAAHVAAVTALGNVHRQGEMEMREMQIRQQQQQLEVERQLMEGGYQMQQQVMQQGMQQGQGMGMQQGQEGQVAPQAPMMNVGEQEMRVGVGHEVSAERGT